VSSQHNYCKTCPYFVLRVNAPHLGITFEGECHRLPPVYVYTPVTPYASPSSFPPVNSTDWCGEHVLYQSHGRTFR
jgi:hypothetical protein